MTTGSPVERVYLDRQDIGVTITSTRAQFGGTTFALPGIVSVAPSRIPASRSGALALSLLGIICGSCGLAADGAVPILVVGGVMLVAGVTWAVLTKDSYAVQLTTAAGQTIAYASKSGDDVAAISLALKTAIAERR